MSRRDLSRPLAIERLLPVSEIAELIGKRERFVRDEIRAKRLSAIRVGIDLRVHPECLREYLEARVYTGPDPRRGPRRSESGNGQGG